MRRNQGLARAVAAGLRSARPHRAGSLEVYDADGEIEKCYEGHMGFGVPEPEAVEAVCVTHGHAEPRTDWRERGVVPRKGWYFPEDTEVDATGRRRPRYGGDSPLREGGPGRELQQRA